MFCCGIIGNETMDPRWVLGDADNSDIHFLKGICSVTLQESAKLFQKDFYSSQYCFKFGEENRRITDYSGFQWHLFDEVAGLFGRP